jgi:hypothetical protein
MRRKREAYQTCEKMALVCISFCLRLEEGSESVSLPRFFFFWSETLFVSVVKIRESGDNVEGN